MEMEEANHGLYRGYEKEFECLQKRGSRSDRFSVQKLEKIKKVLDLFRKRPQIVKVVHD